MTAIDRLRTLTVADIMSRRVIPVSATQTMSEAAKTFADNEVTSAPVVDELGHCIGMLSAADFMKRDCPRDGDPARHELTRDSVHGCISIEPPTDMVSRYMTPAVQAIAANEPLWQAARMMCAEHIHHLPVLDGTTPVGVVSTLDIIAALLNAAEEDESSRS